MFSVAEADPDGAGFVDMLALRGNAGRSSGCLRKRDRSDFLSFQGRHQAETPFQGQFGCGNAEAGGK